ncbi:MAG TPA: hypothetical protein ENJ09_16495 [Planctomycetes bacterium]|nr:hypothetical protein [Planctomycetota bacterium]
MTKPQRRVRLPILLWAVLPLGIGPLQIFLKAYLPDVYDATMKGELGLVENLTVVSLVVAFVTALLLLRHRRSVASPLFGPFCVVMALGCFFFAGEEASWGEHWFGFEVPEEIAERNDQHEFNIHNDPFFENFLDQPPRLALTIFAFVGGVLIPLRKRRRGESDRPRFDGDGIWGWFWPTIECLPSGLVAATITLPKKIARAALGHVPEPLHIGPGETKELAIGLFLMIYLLMMLLELRAQEAEARQAG